MPKASSKVPKKKLAAKKTVTKKAVTKASASKKVHKVSASKPAPRVATKPVVRAQTNVHQESVFAKLLREKKERHEQHMAQNQGHRGSDHAKMPAEHARFSKFAGPRRRAS